MRGGPFSETRVIELLNHRFVPFFFNTGGPGEGHDEAAKDFVLGKVPNRWAYFVALAPDGRVLGMTGIYDGTTEVFALLRALLRRHPEFDRPSDAEANALAKAGTALAPTEANDVARLCERIGKYAEARRAYDRAREVGDAEQRAVAYRGLLRVARVDGDWPAHAAVLAYASASDQAPDLAIDLAIERGLRLLAERRFAAARVAMESALAAAANSARLAELHYEAGRACWFGGDRDWAKAHWCWILEQRPDDRMAMRARLAAGAEAFPYPNGELDNFTAKVGSVGPDALDGGVRAAQRVYQRLRARLLAHDFALESARETAATEAEVELAHAGPPTIDPMDGPDSLVARLSGAREGDAREQLIAQIVAHGEAAAQPLVVAAGNEDFAGRLDAVVAIGELFAAHPSIGAQPRQWCSRLLRDLADGDGELAAAARTSLTAVDAKSTKPAPRRAAPPEPAAGTPALPKGAFLLVAALRDGNEHVASNNPIVDALAALGDATIAPLQGAIADPLFPGRGYAAWALGVVLSKLNPPPEAALTTLREAARDADPYVATLAKSGLDQVK